MPENAPDPHNTAVSESPRKPLGMLWRVLLCLLAGALLGVAFPPFPVPFVLPLAFALLLGMIEGLPSRLAAYLGFACGLTFFGVGLFWLTRLFGFSAVGLWAICAAFPMLFCGWYAMLRRRLSRFPGWLLAPILWTGIEVFRSEYMIPAFPHMGIGYALVNARLLAPLASVFGCYGLTFLVVLCGAGFGRIMVRSVEKSPLLPSVLLLAWMGIFYYNLLDKKPPEPSHNTPLRVRIVQAPAGNEDALFRFSETATQTQTQLLLWPEDGVSDPETDTNLRNRLTRLVQEQHCYLVVSAKVTTNPKDPAAFRKTSFLLDPTGKIIGQHTKVHTVPFFRDGERGTTIRAVPSDLGKLGIGICYDMDFPDLPRKLVQDGAQCFLVSSDNPPEWGLAEPRQHRQLFQMRAIECGRWLANADVGGNMFIVTPLGQVVMVVPDTNTGPGAFTDDIGRETGKTLYVQGGWLFGPLCLAGVAALLIGAFLPVAQRKAG